MVRQVVQNLEILIQQKVSWLNFMAIIGFVFSCIYFLTISTESIAASETTNSISLGTSVNGFNLSYSLIDKNNIFSGGPQKDGIPALVNPPVLQMNQANYIQPSDRVIGVSIGNEARAYPINIIIWHEVINDTLGGIPIAVTYCPLCDSVLVFHRQVGGTVREFGVSGLLYQSNVLLYDRQKNPRNESLWSQISMQAVTGQAAREGLRLTLIDADMMSAQSWISLHPDTTVISIATGYNRSYQQPAYKEYFASDDLMFPVSHTRRRPDLKNKDQVLLVTVNNEYKAYAIPDLLRSPKQVIEDSLAETPFRIVYHPQTNEVSVHPTEIDESGNISNNEIKRAYMFWFAFDAFYPHVDLFRPNSMNNEQ